MAKQPTPEQLLDRVFKANEWHVPAKVRDRYFKMLTLRAVRFYIDSNLDAHTIDEDLADGASDTGYYESGGPLKKTDLCNLIHSEEHETKYFKDQK